MDSHGHTDFPTAMIAMDLSYGKHETDHFVAKRQERFGGRLASSNLLAARSSVHNLDCVQQVTDLVPVQFRANLAWLTTSPAEPLRSFTSGR